MEAKGVLEWPQRRILGLHDLEEMGCHRVAFQCIGGTGHLLKKRVHLWSTCGLAKRMGFGFVERMLRWMVAIIFYFWEFFCGWVWKKEFVGVGGMDFLPFFYIGIHHFEVAISCRDSGLSSSLPWRWREPAREEILLALGNERHLERLCLRAAMTMFMLMLIAENWGLSELQFVYFFFRMDFRRRLWKGIWSTLWLKGLLTLNWFKWRFTQRQQNKSIDKETTSLH